MDPDAVRPLAPERPDRGPGPIDIDSRSNNNGPFPAPLGCADGRPYPNAWYIAVWVTGGGVAGHPGSSSNGERTWRAAGYCSVSGDDPGDYGLSVTARDGAAARSPRRHAPGDAPACFLKARLNAASES
jgi:hypothetical protein